MDKGFVRLYRQITETSVWVDSDKLKLWILCLTKAAYEERKVIIGNQSIELEKGQFVTGRNSLSDEFNRDVKKSKRIDGQTLFRWLNLFEDMEMLNIKKTNKYSIVTVLNWDKYQSNEQQMNNSCTSNEHQLNNKRTSNEHKQSLKELKALKELNTYAQSDCKQSSMQEVPCIISLTLNDKTEYPITEEKISEWKELYPAVDILQELRKMKGWLNANPSKRKTKSGIMRFINSWLSKTQDRGGNSIKGGVINDYPEL